jgi:hypothetical protein
MDKKQLINAVIVLVVLAVLSFFTFKKNLSSWRRGDDVDKAKLLKNFDVNKVAELTITTDSDSLELKKNKDDKWCVSERAGYPANFSKLSSFLLALTEVDVVQYPRLLKSQFPSLKLLSPEKGKKNSDAGSLLTLSDAEGKTLLTLLIGDLHIPKQDETASFQAAQPDGCYVIKDNSGEVALINNPLNTVNTDPKRWIDKTFISIPDIISVTLADAKGKEEWTIYRSKVNAPWALKGLKKGDKPLPRPMMDATSTFANITFDDVSPVGDQKFKDAKTVTITTERGLIYKIHLMAKDKNFIAKCEVSIKPEVSISDKAEKKKESPEKTKKSDKKIAEKRAELEKELKKESFYTNWIYTFPKYKVEKILKTKKELYKPALPDSI